MIDDDVLKAHHLQKLKNSKYLVNSEFQFSTISKLVSIDELDIPKRNE